MRIRDVLKKLKETNLFNKHAVYIDEFFKPYTDSPELVAFLEKNCSYKKVVNSSGIKYTLEDINLYIPDMNMPTRVYIDCNLISFIQKFDVAPEGIVLEELLKYTHTKVKALSITQNVFVKKTKRIAAPGFVKNFMESCEKELSILNKKLRKKDKDKRLCF